MKELIGYKVLTSLRQSCIIVKKGRKFYDKYTKTTPSKGCGPLCIFESYTTAKKYKMNYGLIDCIIVKCEYVKSTNCIVFIKNYYTHGKLEYRNPQQYLQELPTGTVLADSVTCLE